MYIQSPALVYCGMDASAPYEHVSVLEAFACGPIAVHAQNAWRHHTAEHKATSFNACSLWPQFGLCPFYYFCQHAHKLSKSMCVRARARRHQQAC